MRCRSGQGPKVGHSPPPRATQPRRRRSDCSGALSAQPQSGAARDGRGAAAPPARSPRRAVAWAWAAPTLGAAPPGRSQRRAGRGTAALRCASTSIPESECAGKAAPSGAFRARAHTHAHHRRPRNCTRVPACASLSTGIPRSLSPTPRTRTPRSAHRWVLIAPTRAGSRRWTRRARLCCTLEASATRAKSRAPAPGRSSSPRLAAAATLALT